MITKNNFKLKMSSKHKLAEISIQSYKQKSEYNERAPALLTLYTCLTHPTNLTPMHWLLSLTIVLKFVTAAMLKSKR